MAKNDKKYVLTKKDECVIISSRIHKIEGEFLILDNCPSSDFEITVLGELLNDMFYLSYDIDVTIANKYSDYRIDLNIEDMDITERFALTREIKADYEVVLNLFVRGAN